jgi:tetratricopeptide (TPR) repeat protein
MRFHAVPPYSPSVSPSIKPSLDARAGQALDKGRRALAARRFPDAVEAFQAAVRFAPRDAGIRHILGSALAKAGRLTEAVDALKAARDLAPNDAKVQMALADAYYMGGAHAAALPEYLRAGQLDPSNVTAWSNAGGIFRDAGEPEHALAVLHRALALDPRHHMALSNSGLAFADIGEYANARDCFSLALESKPDYDTARWNRAIVDLLRGDFANGWAGHEYRHVQVERMGGLRKFPEPRWDGKRFDGKRLLVWPEQGLGDQLQFVRFLPRVKALGGTVVLACAPPLKALFRECVPSADEIVVIDTPYDACDLQIELMSLPFILGLDSELDAARVPYLHESGVSNAIGSAIPAGADALNVGVVWAGQPKHQNDRNRSLALETLAPLFSVTGTRWFSLQKGDAAEAQLEPLNASLVAKGDTPLVPLGPLFSDFTDTARAISRLDLVITVDTGVAHLAGAMGKPVWIMLPFIPDWRWQVNRDDSPWYPNTRLFRQQRARDWGDVVGRIALALAEKVGAKSGSGEHIDDSLSSAGHVSLGACL